MTENRKEGYYHVIFRIGEGKSIQRWRHNKWQNIDFEFDYKDSDFSYISPDPIPMEQQDLPSAEVMTAYEWLVKNDDDNFTLPIGKQDVTDWMGRYSDYVLRSQAVGVSDAETIRDKLIQYVGKYDWGRRDPIAAINDFFTDYLKQKTNG